VGAHNHISNPLRGFSLIELLVVTAVIALLISLLVPTLSGMRDAARSIACLSNLRQLGVAWSVYADDFQSYAMPLADQIPDSGDTVYWFGAVMHSNGSIEPRRGFLAPYLEDSLHERSVFECPAQPWGTYQTQGLPRSITTTYGYNGYYLCPPKTPGWSFAIGDRPWRRTWEIPAPAELLVFADTLLAGDPPRNSALLDPPKTWNRWRGWQRNAFPTTSFRHGNATAVLTGDVSGSIIRAEKDWLTQPDLGIGSVGLEPSRYIPDWREW